MIVLLSKFKKSQTSVQFSLLAFAVCIMIGLMMYVVVAHTSSIQNGGDEADEKIIPEEEQNYIVSHTTIDNKKAVKIKFNKLKAGYERKSNNQLNDLEKYISYNASKKKLTVEDFKHKILLDIQLTSEYTNYVYAGEDVKVAEFLLVDFDNSMNLFDDIHSFNIKKGYEPHERNFTLKYGTDYITEECHYFDEFPDQNMSYCYNVTKTNWTTFSALSELPHKNIKIGLFTDTVLGDKIEWIPTIQGFNIIEWAEWDVTSGTKHDFDTAYGMQNSLVQIDSTHYLNAYTGVDGYAIVLTVNTGDWTITSGTRYMFDAENKGHNSLVQIDSTHYLNAYKGYADDGYAVVLTVDTGDWTITSGTKHEFDTADGQYNSLVQIDSTHYLNAYKGYADDGYAVVLTVDTGDWTITNGTKHEFDTADGVYNSLVQIDSTHYLNTYRGLDLDDYAVVLTVNTGDWTITSGTKLKFDTAVDGRYNSLVQIDSTHYINTYAGHDIDGYAIVLTVDTGDWTITNGTKHEFDTTCGLYNSLVQIDSTHYINAYYGSDDDGYAVVLTVEVPASDSLSPTVSWNYPTDDSYNTSRTFNVGFTPADETALDNCTLRDNRSGAMANTVGNTSALTNGSINTIAETFTSDGHYNISIKCTDTSSLTAESAGRTIIVDTTSPEIDFISPTPDNNNISKNEYAYVNISISDASDTTSFIDWNNSLVGWWRFNDETDETSTFFRDWSSYANNASCVSPNCSTSTTGKFGKALDFDGINDYLTIADHDRLTTTRLTLSAWFKGSNSNDYAPIISKRSSTEKEYMLSVDCDGAILYDLYVFDNSNNAYITIRNMGNIGICDGNWHHLAGTWNGSTTNTSLKLYLDGVEVTGATPNDDGVFVNMDNTNADVLIGKAGWIEDKVINSTIDEVQIHNRALTPEEINASYNAGLYRLYHNFTDLTDGEYTYTAYAQDLAGNVNETETRTLTIDTVLPSSISISSPTNNSIVNTPTIIGTWTDTNKDTCYTNDSAYSDVSSAFSFTNTSFLSNGRHDILVTCNDSAGNTGSNIVYFTQDATKPFIEFVNPTDTDNDYINNDYTYVNVTTTDTNSGTALIDWNNSLVGWWRFNEQTGTIAQDHSTYGNNGTLHGMNSGYNNGSSGWTTSGKFGNALNFDGSNDYVSTTNNINSSTYTMMAWVLPQSLSVDQRVLFRLEYGGIYLVNGEIIYQTYNGGGYDTQGGTAIGTGDWQYLTIVHNGTHLLGYLNGSLDITPYSCSFGGTSPKYDFIGRLDPSAGGYFFNGTIEEVRIYNRALTPEEINASYNAGLYRLYHNFTDLADGTYTYTAYSQDLAGNVNETETRTLTIDTVLPTVSFNYPDDDSWNNSRTFNVGFTPHDETQLDNCTLRDNRSGAMADTVVNTSILTDNAVNTIAETFTSDGHYNISIKCWDTSSNYAETVGRLIKVDSISPTSISISSPTNNSIVNTPTITGTWTDTNKDTCYTNETAYSGTSSAFSFTNTSFLSNGRHDILVTCNDSAGNTGSNIVYFTQDANPLTYSDNSTNSTYAGQDILHSLKWMDSTGLSGYIFQFCDGTWNGSDCIGSSDIELKEYYNTNDDTQGAIYNNAWWGQTFNASANYDIKKVGTKVFKVGNPGDVSISIYPTNATGHPDTTGTPLVTGTFNGNVITTSSPGEWANTTFDSAYTLTAGTTYAITMNLTGDVSNYIDWRLDSSSATYAGGMRGSSTDGGTTWTMNANYDMMFETYSESGTGWVNDSWVSMTGTTNWSNVTKSVNSTAGIDCAWKVYANDTDNNWNDSSIYSYTKTLDIIPPTIIISSPTNNTYATDSIWFNVTLDESGDWCGYSLDSATNITMTNSSGNWNNQNSSMSEGYHKVIFSCNDTIGNMNSTTTYFTIDTTKPILSIQSPTNTSYTNQTIWFNITTNENLDWCGYSLNGASNITMTNSTGNWNANNATMADATHTIQFHCNDTAGNMNDTTVIFTFDSTKPIISFTSTTPADGSTHTTSSSVTIEVTLTELHPNTCKLDWAGTNYTMTRTGNTCIKTMNDLINTQYEYYVWADDVAGNSNVTANQTVTILYHASTPTPPGAGGTGSTPAPSTKNASITMYETVNPVIIDGQTTLKCAYMNDGAYILNANVNFTVNDIVYPAIKSQNGIYTMPIVMDEAGFFNWICTASKEGYNTVTKSRIIEVMDMTSAVEYLTSLAEEVSQNYTTNETVDLNSSILDETRPAMVSVTGEVMLAETEAHDNLIVFIFVAILLYVVASPKSDGKSAGKQND